MNINQAKAVAAINWNLRSRAEIQRASDHCKALIVAARKSNDDTRAAQLSEARQVFKKRLSRNTCSVCGVRIAPTAEKCRTHMRNSKLIQGQPDNEVKLPKRKKGTQRGVGAPIGGMDAQLGFYTKEVQKVFKKWSGRIREDYLRHYFAQAAKVSIHGGDEIKLAFGIKEWWPAVFEFGLAVSKIVADKNRAESWLMRLPIECCTDGEAQSWEQICKTIKADGGPDFSENTLNKAATRMKLITPKPIADEVRRMMQL